MLLLDKKMGDLCMQFICTSIRILEKTTTKLKRHFEHEHVNYKRCNRKKEINYNLQKKRLMHLLISLF